MGRPTRRTQQPILIAVAGNQMQHDERLGEMSDQVGEKAREAGQEALERGKDVAREAVDSAKETVGERTGSQAAT